jgi:hypothetical protein
LTKGNENLLREIALAEIPEMVCHSNAFENATIPAFRLREKWMIAEEFVSRA